MRTERRSLHPLALLLTIFLFLSTLLAACGSTPGPANVETSGAPPSNTPSPSAQPQESAKPSETPAPTPESADATLCAAYKDDFLIGTIYNMSSTSGPDKKLLLKNFNVITPENLMKPENMQPTEGNFKFPDADKMLQFAQDNGLKAVGHCLVWHQQSGKWLGRNVTREQAIEQLKSHITTIVGKYKGKILSWDVVNEAVADSVKLPSDGDWKKCLRPTQWLDSIGPDYLAMAFQFAHEADPDAKLYYNDYNLNDANKAEIVYAMVKDLKSQGVPIDGIGEQGHYNMNTSPGSVGNSLKLFSQLGVEVSITELDVTVGGAAASGLTKDEEVAQAVLYAKLFSIFKEYKDLIARVTFWGTTDSTSWRKTMFPCLFKGDYTPKEAYYAVLDPEKYLSDHMEANTAAPNRALAKFGTPVIDGEVDDIWNNSTQNPVATQLTAWDGAVGNVRLLWDEKYVYALFMVKDDNLNKQSANAYEQDSIEIFLDQNNGKTSSYDADDGQYRVNFDGESSFGTVPGTDGFVAKAKRSPIGYTVEMAIPLSAAVKEGAVMGFDAQINDSDDKGVRQSIAKFNDPTDNSFASTEKWGELELVK